LRVDGSVSPGENRGEFCPEERRVSTCTAQSEDARRARSLRIEIDTPVEF
jgi:hypothetical protein